MLVSFNISLKNASYIWGENRVGLWWFFQRHGQTEVSRSQTPVLQHWNPLHTKKREINDKQYTSSKFTRRMWVTVLKKIFRLLNMSLNKWIFFLPFHMLYMCYFQLNFFHFFFPHSVFLQMGFEVGMSKFTAMKEQSSNLKLYTHALSHDFTYRVSHRGLQWCVLLLLAADMVKGEKNVVVVWQRGGQFDLNLVMKVGRSTSINKKKTKKQFHEYHKLIILESDNWGQISFEWLAVNRLNCVGISYSSGRYLDVASLGWWFQLQPV